MRVVLGLAILLVLPLAVQGSAGGSEPAPAFAAFVEPTAVDTTLYLHLIDALDMPINTQVPEPESGYADLNGVGLAGSSLTCLDPYTGDIGGTGQGTQGTTSQEFFTFRGYSSTGFVEYDFLSSDSSPRTWPQRGLAQDIVLDRTGQPVLRWYMAEVGAASGVGTPDAQPSLSPNVVVRAEVLAPESETIDGTGYDSGALLMQGVTLPVTVASGQVLGEGAPQVSASEVDGRWVYEFAIPLKVLADAIPRATGFTLRIDVLVDNEVCEQGKLMPGTLEPYGDAQHQPALVLRNEGPLRVDGAHVQSFNGTTVAAWTVMSPWGNYDVAVDDAALRVFGPVDVVPTPAYTIQRSREHYHLLDPVEQAWTLPADLPDGRYTAVFTVPNLQHTATAQATVVFHVQDGRVVAEEPSKVPAPGAVSALLVLAVAAILVARRR